MVVTWIVNWRKVTWSAVRRNARPPIVQGDERFHPTVLKMTEVPVVFLFLRGGGLTQVQLVVVNYPAGGKLYRSLSPNYSTLSYCRTVIKQRVIISVRNA